MREQNELLTLTSWQLEEQLETIKYFLNAVHPNLTKEGKGFRPCVELRPINRGEDDYMLSKSLMLWDLKPESVERLRAFLERHNGQTTCLFYSVFSYDNLKNSKADDSASKKSTRINTATALTTEEIALDFDNISYHDYRVLVDRFEALDIFALWVFSGHGYQAHILLNESLEDKDILLRLVYKFRSKGFHCDPACVDPARLMRLPYTFNCKCFKDEAYADELEDPPFCKIMQEANSRYSLEDILQKLDQLDTVSKADESVYLKETKKAMAAKQHAEEDSVSVRKVEYPYLSNYPLPGAVEKMLAYTPHGVRNKALGYMIRLFKTKYRISKTQMLEILTIWAKEACEPVYPQKDLERDFARLYYEYNGLGYDADLVKHFGVLENQEIISLRQKNILIPNAFFRDLNTLDGKVVRLYLGIKMLEHVDEPATVEKLCELLDLSVRALRYTLQELLQSGHGYVTKGNRRRKEPDVYHTHRGYSIQDGYMTFSYNDIKAYITELFDKGSRGHGELKLYLFMRWKFFSGDIYMAQENLGKNINVAQNTISDIVRRLEEKHFIKVEKKHMFSFFENCEYTLLR